MLLHFWPAKQQQQQQHQLLQLRRRQMRMLMLATDPSKPVLLAGDKEKNGMADVDAAGGIQYLENQLKTCEKLAEILKIEPLSFV
ncbi:GD14940 [Drosophila simulans]|uniref:GD14940 n=1 Tax=Drosophila simulans TaxID=7240 RepID=B4QJP3_DROSI|nr:GD14940 [Drosophila simulans]